MTKTGKTEAKHVKFTHDETTLIRRRKTSFPDAVSGDQSQALVNIQNLFLDHYIPERVTTISISRKSNKSASWHIPETATGSIFFPSSHSASSRIFGKETSQMKISRKSKEAASKITNIYFGDMFKDILILSGPSSTTSQAITPKHKKVGSEYLLSSKDKTYTFKQQLVGPRATVPSPVPELTRVKAERWWSPRFKEKTAVILSITHFPGLISIPSPVLPRKPHRQSLLETQVTESENLESAPRQITPSLSEEGDGPHKGHDKVNLDDPWLTSELLGFFSYDLRRKSIIKSKNQEDSQAHVIHGGGLKTVNVTRYETIITMTNFAIVNCQIYGRNALKLKGFFLMNCPDLTPLASQLIYLNLSFNDISHFPTEVFWLFSLSHLEELDISYNSIDSIPNEIQKLSAVASGALFCVFVSFSLLAAVSSAQDQKHSQSNFQRAFLDGSFSASAPGDAQLQRLSRHGALPALEIVQPSKLHRTPREEGGTHTGEI
ncbi:Leucine-rich repeat-containing protein 63 [Vulpes lagopus]